MQVPDDALARAGLSFLFEAGERPDRDQFAAALAACQAEATITHDDGAGKLEVLATGLTFRCDGILPDTCDTISPQPLEATMYGFPEGAGIDAVEPVRLYPGPHLSGGANLTPVVRSLLALAAELAVGLPCRAVQWHPAGTVIAPTYFSRAVLGWLAGGAFPAMGLTALTRLADGNVASRGLAHFCGYDLLLRLPKGSEDMSSCTQAAVVADYLVRHGAPAAHDEQTIGGTRYGLETAHHARQVIVWPVALPATAG